MTKKPKPTSVREILIGFAMQVAFASFNSRNYAEDEEAQIQVRTKIEQALAGIRDEIIRALTRQGLGTEDISRIVNEINWGATIY